MKNPERYFLCDQSLKSFSGHCYAYFEPLMQILQARGTKVVLVGHNILEQAVAARGVVPCFTYWCDERNFGQAANLNAEASADLIRTTHEKAIFADLQRLHRRFHIRAADRLVINSIHHWAIRGVVKWLETLSAEDCPQVALLLHFSSQPERFHYDPAMRLYGEAFTSIENSPRRHRIHLYADATTLIDEYHEMTSLDIALAPFPHSSFQRTTDSDRHANRPLRVAYIGEARFHKGFQLLPFIADRLWQSDLGETVEFHIHSFIFDREAIFYHQAMAHLRRAPNVTLYPNILDPREYEDFLGRCDVVLLPYLLSYYHRQTSGIFADAIGMGVPAVVSRGTWMAKEMKRLGGGGLTANPEDYISFADATYRLCRNIDQYREEARHARELWYSFNTPENMVDMFERW